MQLPDYAHKYFLDHELGIRSAQRVDSGTKINNQTNLFTLYKRTVMNLVIILIISFVEKCVKG